MYALAVLDSDVIVSGAGDGSLCVWVRLPESPRTFAALHELRVEHDGAALRALVALPACGACPTGGFASGALDGVVRLFSFNPATRAVALARTLVGHTGGVDSLSVAEGGQVLFSGSRDGSARAWSLATGDCVQTLGGHENKVVVCALAGGGLATGSAGRKNERDQHVDYRLRVWARGAGAAAQWALQRVVEDHEQAIQDLDVMPGGEVFISSSNDGTVRLRLAADGAAFDTLATPVGAEGKAIPVYRGKVLPNSWVAACCDDNVVRMWDPEGGSAVADEVLLPGNPWAVRGLSNGDVVMGCTHVGSGKVRGWGRFSPPPPPSLYALLFFGPNIHNRPSPTGRPRVHFYPGRFALRVRRRGGAVP